MTEGEFQKRLEYISHHVLGDEIYSHFEDEDKPIWVTEDPDDDRLRMIEEARRDLSSESFKQWISPTEQVDGEVRWADGKAIEYICIPRERFEKWFGCGEESKDE